MRTAAGSKYTVDTHAPRGKLHGRRLGSDKGAGMAVFIPHTGAAAGSTDACNPHAAWSAAQRMRKGVGGKRVYGQGGSSLTLLLGVQPGVGLHSGEDMPLMRAGSGTHTADSTTPRGCGSEACTAPGTCQQNLCQSHAQDATATALLYRQTQLFTPLMAREGAATPLSALQHAAWANSSLHVASPSPSSAEPESSQQPKRWPLQHDCCPWMGWLLHVETVRHPAIAAAPCC